MPARARRSAGARLYVPVDPDPIDMQELVDMALAYLSEELTVWEVAVRFQRGYVEVRQAFEDWQVPLRHGTPPEPRVVPKNPEPPPKRRIPKLKPRQKDETSARWEERRAAHLWAHEVLPKMQRQLFLLDKEPARHQRGDVFTSGDRYERGVKRGGDYDGLLARRRRETEARIWDPGTKHEMRQAGLMGWARVARSGRYWH